MDVRVAGSPGLPGEGFFLEQIPTPGLGLLLCEGRCQKPAARNPAFLALLVQHLVVLGDGAPGAEQAAPSTGNVLVPPLGRKSSSPLGISMAPLLREACPAQKASGRSRPRMPSPSPFVSSVPPNPPDKGASRQSVGPGAWLSLPAGMLARGGRGLLLQSASFRDDSHRTCHCGKECPEQWKPAFPWHRPRARAGSP